MNALTLRPIEADVCGAGFFLEPNPFELSSMRYIEVPDGCVTLDDYAAEAAKHLPRGYHSHLEITLGEHKVPPANWALVKPKPTASVYIRVRPKGKGVKNILRAVILIAIIAIATVYLGPTSAFITSTLGLTGAAAAVASAVLIAAVGIVGQLLVNALIPPPGLTNQNANKDPRYQLSGSNNRYAPYAPIPYLSGKMRVYPLIAGRPYTENFGKKQYLRMLLLVGWGPIKVSDIRIGNTPIEIYKNVQYEVTEGGPAGWAGNKDITLYNRKVTEQNFNIYLPQNSYAPFQTTAVDTVEIGIDLLHPFGLMKITQDGNKKTATSEHIVQYRVAGSNGAWLAPTLESDTSYTTSGAGKFIITAMTPDALRTTIRFKVPEGRYEVRVVRTDEEWQNSDDDDTWLDKVYWTILRSFSTDEPVIQDGICMIAIRMQATDQLNGVPDTISCVAEAYKPVYGLGSELVTNGTFTTATTGWTAQNSATLSIVSNRLNVASGAPGNGYASQSFATVVGHRYQVRYDKFKGTGTAARFRLGTSLGGAQYLDDASAGDKTGNETVITATGATLYIGLQSDGTSGQASQFDNVSIIDLDANSNWSYQLTQNPAWTFADILRRRAGMADNRLDIAAIQSWALDCSTVAPNSSEPRWTYNGVIEGGTIFDALRQVASIGRGAYVMKDGKHSVVRDKAQATPVQHITPANSWGYSGTRTFADLPHALKVEFQNKDFDYQIDERVVYADGYDETNAEKFEVLQLFGATSADLVFREARYHMAVASARPEEHRVNMDIENLRCSLGDRVQLTHDVISVGTGFGRIAALQTSGANTIGFTLDAKVEFRNDTTYQFRTREKDGTTSIRAVTPNGGTQNLQIRSEDFDNAEWTKSAATVTANAGSAPDGSTTADKLIGNNTAARHLTYATIKATGTGYTFSVHAKPAGKNYIALGFTNTSTIYSVVLFNLATGKVVSPYTLGTSNAVTGEIYEAEEGFYQCVVHVPQALVDEPARYPVILVGNGGDPLTENASHNGTDGVLLWGAQVQSLMANGGMPYYVKTTTVAAYGGWTNSIACAAEPTTGGPAAGDLFMFGVTGLESLPAIVKRIEPGDDLSAVLTLVPYNDAIYTADTGAIPAFNSYMNSDPERTSPSPPTIALRSDATVAQNNNQGTTYRLAIDITPPASSAIALTGFEVRYRLKGSDDWRQLGNLTPFSTTTVYVTRVNPGEVYQVAARSKGVNGLYSDWTQAPDHTIVGNTLPPANPTGATITINSNGVLIKWTNPATADLRGVQVWMNPVQNFNGAIKLGETLTGQWLHAPVYSGDDYYYWLVSVNKSGTSQTPLYIGFAAIPDVATGGGDSYVEGPVGGSGIPYWKFESDTVYIERF